MRRMIRFRSSVHCHLQEFQILNFSSITRKRKSSSRSSAIQGVRAQDKLDTSSFRSLFNEITEILSSESYVCDKTSSQNSILNKIERDIASGEKPSPSLRTADVCENAEQEIETRVGVLEETDDSAIVHQVSAVVRDGNCVVPMEERLGNLDVRFSSEVVDKVLKRCFKVPHLAFRFFNWLELKDGFQYTTNIFNTILTIAGEAKDFELVDKLVRKMENYSLEKDIKTWTILISLYGNTKFIGKALFIYSKMRESGCEPDIVVYKTLIRSLSTSGRPELAMEFYQEMVKKGFGLDIKIYKLLLSCFAASGDSSSVLVIVNDMIAFLDIPEHDVYHYVLKCFCISSRIKEALEFIHGLNSKNKMLGPEYFEILVRGLCRSDRIGDAWELVEIMKKKDFDVGKVYGVIINWYLRKNDISKALDLFQNMKNFGYLPTTSTYTQLMQHLFRLAEYEKGFELYKEMMEKGIEVDDVATMAVVVGHVRQNQTSEAWKMIKSMKNKPTRESFSVFINELYKVSRTDEIIKVLNEMRDLKMDIPDRLFDSVISYMERRGDMISLEMVKKMKGRTELFPPEAEVNGGDNALMVKDLNIEMNFNHSEPISIRHVEALPIHYSENDVQEVYKILSSSTDSQQISKSLEKCNIKYTPELVLEILCKCKVHGCAALHFFSWVGKRSGYNHTTETYNMAIKLAGLGKDFKHMRALFYEMRRRGCLITSDTWTIMIMQYGRAGLTDIALKLFQEMKNCKINPTGSTYKYLIISLCGKKRNKVDEAIALFQEMIQFGHIPDKELLETYLCCLCKLDKLSFAKECIDYLPKVGFTLPLVYSLYIRALCSTGKLDIALALLEEVRDERSKLDHYTYGSLIRGLLQRNRSEEAWEKVNLMKRVGVNPTVHVYTSFMVYSFKENQIKRALEILAKMLHEGCELTIATYSAVIHGYMNMGKSNDALKIFNYIRENGPFPDFKAYSMLISCLCKAGKSEEALQLISEMLSNGVAPSTINFRTVFFGLNREGKQKLASTVLQQKLALIRRRKFQL